MTKYHIRYLPLSGGKFLGQLLTVGLDKCSKHYFDLYDKKNISWTTREDMFLYHKDVDVKCSHTSSFRKISELENLIFISTTDDESIDKVKLRNRHVSTAMKNVDFQDLKIKYHNECHTFLTYSEIDFFDFKFKNFWNRQHFLDTMEKLGKYIDIEFDEKILVYAHKKWIQSNIIGLQTTKDVR